MSSVQSSPDYRAMAPRAPEGNLDLEALHPGGGPLELDIGFGRGLSVFERASEAPESRLIGIEIKSKWAYKVAERVQREKLERLKIVCGDARELLHRSGPEEIVSRVFVHFPDPWWKKRHAKRMVVAEPLLDDLARLLINDGDLFIQTDVEARAAQYHAAIEGHAAFRFPSGSGYIESNPFRSISNRERRAEQDGLPVYRLLAQRTPR